jgi:hypothetical protein
LLAEILDLLKSKLDSSGMVQTRSGNAATSGLRVAARKNGNDFPLLPKPLHPEDLLKKLAEWGLPAARKSVA